MRSAEIVRKTNETDIKLTLNLDGKGKNNIDTGCGFLDHMITLFSKHSEFDLDVKVIGDTNVDFHHSVEDVGICLGKAFSEAIGDKKGINRYGNFMLPMDESLVLVALDISGRGMLTFDAACPSEKVGEFDTELNEEFWEAFANNAGITLHIKKMYGKNSHHIIEACFKGVARALKIATAVVGDTVPSTKGVL